MEMCSYYDFLAMTHTNVETYIKKFFSSFGDFVTRCSKVLLRERDADMT